MCRKPFLCDFLHSLLWSPIFNKLQKWLQNLQYFGMTKCFSELMCFVFFFLLCFLPKGRGEKKNWIPWHLLGKQHFIFTQTLTLIKSPDIWDVGKCSTNFAEEEMNSQWPGHWPGSRNKPVSGGECCSGTAAGHESSGQLSCAHKERDHWECRWFYVSHQTWKARDSPENTCF